MKETHTGAVSPEALRCFSKGDFEMKRKLTKLFSVLLAATMLCTVLAGCAQSKAVSELTVAEATYPEAVKAPGDSATDEEFETWQTYNEKRTEAAKGNLSAMKSYYKKTLGQVLGESKAASEKTDDNAVYSPLNVYLALAMLAETADGDSQKQILTLLGEKNLKSLETRVKNLFTANYQDDGSCTELLANSLWMNEALTYKQDTLDSLAENHYASSFAGEPGSEKMDKALQGWVNENTNNLLKDQAANLSLDPATVLALVSTIYFKAAWADTFDESNTKKQTFYAPSGEVKADMMYQSLTTGYYSGTNFEAVALPLTNSGYMWFFLPKKGSTVGDLPTDKQVLSLLTDTANYKNFSYPQVNLTLPKLDVVSDVDLVKDLKAVGVTDVFDAQKADFSPLMEGADNVYVSEVKHAARVKTDEDGVEAAAYTVIGMMKSSLPTDFVDFNVNRPFYFVITGYTGDLLFTGLVNNPVA